MITFKPSIFVVKAEEKAPPKAPPKGWKIPTQSLEALYRTGAELMEIGASNDDVVQQSSSSCQSPSTSNADPQTTLQDLYRTGEELIRSGHSLPSCQINYCLPQGRPRTTSSSDPWLEILIFDCLNIKEHPHFVGIQNIQNFRKILNFEKLNEIFLK